MPIAALTTSTAKLKIASVDSTSRHTLGRERRRRCSGLAFELSAFTKHRLGRPKDCLLSPMSYSRRMYTSCSQHRHVSFSGYTSTGQEMGRSSISSVDARHSGRRPWRGWGLVDGSSYRATTKGPRGKSRWWCGFVFMVVLYRSHWHERTCSSYKHSVKTSTYRVSARICSEC